MLAMIKLHLIEHIRWKQAVLYGVLGCIIALLFLLMMMGGGLAVNDQVISSTAGLYGVQWTVLSFVGGTLTVLISSGSLHRHREQNYSDMLRLHHVSLAQQYKTLALANALTSISVGLFLLVGITVQQLITGSPSHIIAFLAAILIFLFIIVSVSLYSTFLSFFLPPIMVNLLGSFLIIVGTFHSLFESILLNSQAPLARLGAWAIQFVLPLDRMNQLLRNVYFWDSPNLQYLLTILLIIWGLMTLIIIASKGVERLETHH